MDRRRPGHGGGIAQAVPATVLQGCWTLRGIPPAKSCHAEARGIRADPCRVDAAETGVEAGGAMMSTSGTVRSQCSTSSGVF